MWDTWGCPVVFYTSPRFESEKHDEIVAKLGEVREQLINKEIAVFEGPIYAQDGSVMFEDGYRPTIEEINVIDQLVQGVKGSMN